MNTTDKEDKNGKADHVTTLVCQGSSNYRRYGRGFWKPGTKRVGRLHVQRSVWQGHRCRENVLPWLRQDGMWRQGHRTEWARDTH
jgi:hypothetical protein